MAAVTICSDFGDPPKIKSLIVSMTNLDSILKSRDIPLPTKVLIESKLWFF